MKLKAYLFEEKNNPLTPSEKLEAKYSSKKLIARRNQFKGWEGVKSNILASTEGLLKQSILPTLNFSDGAQ